MDAPEKKVRPKVTVPNTAEQHLPVELFQNEVLRPILKLQHPILVAFFHQCRTKFTEDWEALKKNKKKAAIDNLMTKQAPLRHAIQGIIIGQMNEEEFSAYLLHQKEYDRRINRMTIQRIQSTLD